MQKIHLVTFAEGEPFTSVQKLIIDSAKSAGITGIIEKWDMTRLKKTSFYKENSNLFTNNSHRFGYASWKSFICYDLYKKVDDGDYIIYADSSQYHHEGFLYSWNPVIDFLERTQKITYGIIAGCRLCFTNNDFNHVSPITCEAMNLDIKEYGKKPHYQNSWFVIKKTKFAEMFLQEWLFYSIKKKVISSSHTNDQAIFSLLCNKYNLYAFCEDPKSRFVIRYHCDKLKNPNMMLKYFNENPPFNETLLNSTTARLAICNGFRLHLINPYKYKYRRWFCLRIYKLYRLQRMIKRSCK